MNEQNWFAVVIDFVIVVVGVFIGIQVSNWNDAQGDQRLGHYYTQRLIVDLEDDLAASSSLFEYYNQVLMSVEQANELFLAETPDAQAVVTAAYRASEFNNNPTNSATWDQIVSSGHIGLLPNVATERGLSEYYKFQESLNAGSYRVLESPYRIAVRSLIPLSIQFAIRDGCSDILGETNISQGFVSECLLDVDEGELRSTADALLASKAVRESLRYQYSIVSLVIINHEGNIVQIKEVLNALRSTP